MAYNNSSPQRSSDRVSYNILEPIGVIGEKQDGWKKEVNIVSWNGGQGKVDIRDWDPEHRRMTKGITLFEEEAENLGKVLIRRYGLGNIGSTAKPESGESEGGDDGSLQS